MNTLTVTTQVKYIYQIKSLFANECVDSILLSIVYSFHENFFLLLVYFMLPNVLNIIKDNVKLISSLFTSYIYKSILGVSFHFVWAYVFISPTVFFLFYFLSGKEYVIFLVVAFPSQNSPGSPLTDLDIQEGVSLQD